MLKIEFTRSRSKQFPEVLSLARSFLTFKESDGVYSVIFSESDIFSQWDRFSQFHNQITKWSGCNVYFKGNLMKPYRMILYYALQNIVLCAKSQNLHLCKLPNGLPGWGCSFLHNVSRHLDSCVYAYWYNFGHFSDDMKTWIVDKDLLYDKLISQANESYLTLCPHFDKVMLKQIINSLPGNLAVDDVNFEIRYRRDFVGTRIMNIPAGVTHIEAAEVKIAELPFEKSVDDMTDEEINRMIEERRQKK